MVVGVVEVMVVPVVVGLVDVVVGNYSCQSGLGCANCRGIAPALARTVERRLRHVRHRQSGSVAETS